MFVTPTTGGLRACRPADFADVLADFTDFGDVRGPAHTRRASAPWASLTQVDPADLGELSGIDRLGIRIVILILIYLSIYLSIYIDIYIYS